MRFLNFEVFFKVEYEFGFPAEFSRVNDRSPNGVESELASELVGGLSNTASNYKTKLTDSMIRLWPMSGWYQLRADD